MGKIANRQHSANVVKPMNANRADSNCNAPHTWPIEDKFLFFGGELLLPTNAGDSNHSGNSLASDSANSIAQFRPSLRVPKPGCYKPGCLQRLRGCALLRSFALFCGLAFALFCAQLLLCSFALNCMFLRPTASRTTAFGNC